MLVAPDTIKGYANAKGLGLHLGPCWCLRVTLPIESYQSEWCVLPPGAMVLSISGLLPRAMSGSVAPSKPGSELMSVAPDTIEGLADIRGLDCHLGPCWGLRGTLPWGMPI